ncbi:MAG: hypothetical protein JSW66_09915 [Phycisphaerales bacterium]|nr:MAG: hypothetical protein JSW66_09915 [Phycisphaerales bacterium]
MRLRDITILSVCLIVVIGLFITAGVQLDSINRQRQDMGLIIDTPEDIPPSLVFATVATGAFRGLVVDALWMRADTLKEQGQFFDARQLAEWITLLQPRFASVWEFHAWNMAYNISVAIPATQPDQRWRWVRNGYELLRDEAITKYKLKNVTLYRELSRIFQHKIGGVSDDAHKYYKLQLAMALEPLLGSQDNQLDWQENRYFDALAQTPADWQEIAADPNVAPLLAALKSADEAFSDDDEFVGLYLSLRQNSGRFKPEAANAIDEFRGTEALRKFDLFAKAHELRETWKLDPVVMRDLNRTYGPVDFRDPNTHLPLDWRHPDSHAIYWAVTGLQMAAREESREFEMSETNTDRSVGHSLQNLFRNGKIFIHDVPLQVPAQDGSQEFQTQIFKEVFLRPDLRMFDTYNRTVLAVLEKYRDDTSYESLQNGHRNMLKNAVLLFYQAGHRAMAQKIYSQMRTLYPRDEFKSPAVEVYVKKRFDEELENIAITDAKEMIIGMLTEAYFRYALRDDDEAAGIESLAKEIWEYYQSKYRDENRIDLPDFKLLRYLALQDFLEDLLYPPNLRLSLLARIEIEKPDLAELLKPWKDQLEQQKEQIRQQEQNLLRAF